MSAPQPPSSKDGPRVNHDITAFEVLVIDDEGTQRGIMKKIDAIRLAEEEGYDLVEVAPMAKPPVCRLMDFGKFKYEQQKKAAEARKKQKVIEIKELKMRPTIDDHDYDVKMRAIKRFFEDGEKVKVTLRFRGREMAHQELGYQLLQKVKGDLVEIHAALPRPRDAASASGHGFAQPHPHRARSDREGRTGPEARRTSDDDGDGAEVKQLGDTHALRFRGARREVGMADHGKIELRNSRPDTRVCRA